MSERATRDADAEANDSGLRGPRVVVALYALIVAVAAFAGVLLSVFVDGLHAPRFLFLVPFPPTPAGFAAYGALTVALLLGVPLALVAYVSRTVDEGA